MDKNIKTWNEFLNEKLFEEFSQLNEKKLKTEGEDTLAASSYAYTPEKDKPSTWKLRIDDANHAKAAVAALGKGFRGNKVDIPRGDLEKVKSKVRRAYKKFFPKNELPEVLKR